MEDMEETKEKDSRYVKDAGVKNNCISSDRSYYDIVLIGRNICSLYACELLLKMQDGGQECVQSVCIIGEGDEKRTGTCRISPHQTVQTTPQSTVLFDTSRHFLTAHLLQQINITSHSQPAKASSEQKHGSHPGKSGDNPPELLALSRDSTNGNITCTEIEEQAGGPDHQQQWWSGFFSIFRRLCYLAKQSTYSSFVGDKGSYYWAGFKFWLTMDYNDLRRKIHRECCKLADKNGGDGGSSILELNIGSREMQLDGMTVEEYVNKNSYFNYTRRLLIDLINCFMGSDCRNISMLYFLFCLSSSGGIHALVNQSQTSIDKDQIYKSLLTKTRASSKVHFINIEGGFHRALRIIPGSEKDSRDHDEADDVIHTLVIQTDVDRDDKATDCVDAHPKKRVIECKTIINFSETSLSICPDYSSSDNNSPTLNLLQKLLSRTPLAQIKIPLLPSLSSSYPSTDTAFSRSRNIDFISHRSGYIPKLGRVFLPSNNTCTGNIYFSLYGLKSIEFSSNQNGDIIPKCDDRLLKDALIRIKCSLGAEGRGCRLDLENMVISPVMLTEEAVFPKKLLTEFNANLFHFGTTTPHFFPRRRIVRVKSINTRVFPCHLEGKLHLTRLVLAQLFPSENSKNPLFIPKPCGYSQMPKTSEIGVSFSFAKERMVQLFYDYMPTIPMLFWFTMAYISVCFVKYFAAELNDVVTLLYLYYRYDDTRYRMFAQKSSRFQKLIKFLQIDPVVGSVERMTKYGINTIASAASLKKPDAQKTKNEASLKNRNGTDNSNVSSSNYYDNEQNLY